MDKMKVLMIGPDRSVHGGISGVVNNYYTAGLDREVDLTYLGTMTEGSKFKKLCKAVRAYLQFLTLVKQFDIIHVNAASDRSFERKSFFVRAAKRRGKRIILHQHGGDFEHYYANAGQRKKAFIRKILGMADKVLVLSPEVKPLFCDLTDPDRVVVLPNAVTVPAAYDKEYGQQRILFLGRICETKGIRELLEAVTEIVRQYPGTQFYLGGIFEDEKLRELITPLSRNVTWLGWLGEEEKQRFLRFCDIFVLPTYFEGHPVSVLEAMAYSCAVVASNVGGIPQMIRRNENGILVEPKQTDALIQGLSEVLADKELCRRLGSQARSTVEQSFSMKEHIRQLLTIYQELSELRA